MEASSESTGGINSSRASLQNQGSDKKRILVVDDDESILWSLSRILTTSYKNYSVDTASSAEEALSIIKNTQVDVLVTDFKLPKMNGLKLTETLREVSPQTRSILITAYGNEQMVEQATNSGCVAYLEKPFDVSLLIKHISRSLQPMYDLRVELAGVTLLDIVKIYVMKQEDMVLSIVSKDMAGIVVVQEGRVTHVEFGDLVGIEAFDAILNCHEGVVSSVSREIPPQETLSLTYEDLEKSFQLSTKATLQGRSIQGGGKTKSLGVNIPAPQLALPNSPAYDSRQDVPISNASSEVAQQVSSEDKIGREAAGEGAETAPAQAITEKTPANEKYHQQPSTSREGDVSSKKRSTEKGPIAEENPSLKTQGGQTSISEAEEQERKQANLRELINTGIEYFRKQQFNEARECWICALRLDPDCTPAKNNLKILEQVLRTKLH